MARHILTYEERSRGGRTRSQQDTMAEARSKGFKSTCEKHPYFARHWLKLKIRGIPVYSDALTFEYISRFREES